MADQISKDWGERCGVAIGDLYFSQGGFLFDPSTGITFALNRTGSFIFERLRNRQAPEQILDALVENFEVEPERAEEDLRDFMQQVRDFGLG